MSLSVCWDNIYVLLSLLLMFSGILLLEEYLIFNRPDVARAVLKTPYSFIHSFIYSPFSSKSSLNLHSQTNQARDLKFLQNFHLPNVSHVTCWVSRIMCHVSHATYHLSHITIFPRGGASWWRFCLIKKNDLRLFQTLFVFKL